jgi:hypothetical protein
MKRTPAPYQAVTEMERNMIGYTPQELDLRAHPDTARFDDGRRILAVAKGILPFPYISPGLAVFFYAGMPDAEQARAAVEAAAAVLASAFSVRFAPRITLAGGTRHYILGAVLPSGMRLEIAALAGHFDSQDTPVPAPELAEAAA